MTLWNVFERVRTRPNSKNEVRSALNRFADAPTESAREAELARIRAMGDSAHPVLVEALEDPSIRIQIAAAQTLSRLRNERVRDLLVAYARQQPPMSESGEEWSLEGISPRLVQVAMGRAEKEERAQPLLNLIGPGPLDSEVSEAVSRWVSTLLASSRPPLQRLGLEIATETEIEFPWRRIVTLLGSPEVGVFALEALRGRTGRDFGTDAARWKQYFEEM